MKRFEYREVTKAIDYALKGGQALHTSPGRSNDARAPLCFRRSKLWGHLLDQNEGRLVKTARRLGVRKIVVSNRGNRIQHVDLCGKPLVRGLEECD